jgi:hypothetical protein
MTKKAAGIKLTDGESSRGLSRLPSRLSQDCLSRITERLDDQPESLYEAGSQSVLQFLESSKGGGGIEGLKTQ